eukprot:scaffold207744_cov18-Tisochrysis_lutea.AAC.1
MNVYNLTKTYHTCKKSSSTGAVAQWGRCGLLTRTFLWVAAVVYIGKSMEALLSWQSGQLQLPLCISPQSHWAITTAVSLGKYYLICAHHH